MSSVSCLPNIFRPRQDQLKDDWELLSLDIESFHLFRQFHPTPPPLSALAREASIIFGFV
jgi:hypothetical protein